MRLTRHLPILVWFAQSILDAQPPPPMIHYQGRVSVSGVPFDGLGHFKFALVEPTGEGPDVLSYWSNDGSSEQGSEPSVEVPLQVTRGLYSVLLGNTEIAGMTSPILAARLDHDEVLLRVWFNTGNDGFKRVTPDQRIASVAYALIAQTAKNVAPGAVAAEQLADGAVTAAKLAPGALDSVRVAPGDIGTSELADEAVTAAKLADGAVTSDKLAPGALDSVKVAPGDIGSLELSDGAVTAAKLADRAVTAAKLAPGALDSVKVGLGTIGTAELADRAVNAAKLDEALAATLPRLDADQAFAGTNQFTRKLDLREGLQAGGPIRLDAADGPMIVRDWTPFDSGVKQGLGRWGMFMEPAKLFLGVAGSDYGSQSSIGFGGWTTNGLREDWMTILKGGNVGIGTQSPGAPLQIAPQVGKIEVLILGAGADQPGTTAMILGLNSPTNGYALVQAVKQSGSEYGDLILNRDGGNVGIGTSSPSPSAKLEVNGEVRATVFNPTSDRNAKEHLSEVDTANVLAKVAALPIMQWQFKASPGERHLGPMAQDFHAAFGLGADDKHIATVDADGVALAAIQGLHQELKERTAEIQSLRDQNESLARRLSDLESALRATRKGD